MGGGVHCVILRGGKFEKCFVKGSANWTVVVMAGDLDKGWFMFLFFFFLYRFLKMFQMFVCTMICY